MNKIIARFSLSLGTFNIFATAAMLLIVFDARAGMPFFILEFVPFMVLLTIIGLILGFFGLSSSETKSSKIGILLNFLTASIVIIIFVWLYTKIGFKVWFLNN